MIAKEWRDARWKLLIAAVPVVVLVLTLPPFAKMARTARNVPTESRDGSPLPKNLRMPTDPLSYASDTLWGFLYSGGFLILFPLAVVLGVFLISGEVGSGSMFLVLSKPIGRARLLLVKYGVGVATLLATTVFGVALLIGVAAWREYPLGRLHVPELLFASVLIWLGALFIFGLTLFVSVATWSATSSAVATCLALCLVFALPQFALTLFYSFQDTFTDVSPGMQGAGPVENVVRSLNLTYYWTGEGLLATNFIVSLVVALVPLLAALWLFNRKAY